ncbi:hypothetical protein TL16_g07416 [Triparma laevis f. inornata]|nr:hypothetical protein TL16_g07416 [Triparma laevis f. inornata]
MAAFIEQSVNSILSSVDEDTREYIISLITDGDADDIEDTKEAVNALIEGADEDNADELTSKLWTAIESNAANAPIKPAQEDVGEVTKLLSKKITIGDSDIVTAGSGILAQADDETQPRGFSVANFFANQIGIRSEAAVSEKKRRKMAQQKLREEQERREREIALEHQMSLAATGETLGSDDYSDEISDNAQDCHLVNFNLPNKKGSGLDLLSNVNLTLSKGRRYGLVGRNGCGKTTLMELISQRQVPGVPKNLSLLLVKQEIMGSDRTALETVIRSDTRREGLLNFIKKMEEEDDKAESLAKAYERLAVMEEESGPTEPR